MPAPPQATTVRGSTFHCSTGVKPLKTYIKLGITTLLLTVSAHALAGADCTSEPQEKWMSRMNMQKKIIEMGYTIDRFKIDGNCYEIYGRNVANKKVEIYFNPVTGEIVKEEIES
jgi:hypothetical protein